MRFAAWKTPRSQLTQKIPDTPAGDADGIIDGRLFAADVTGMGYAILQPQSERSFLYRGAVIEFILDAQGTATHLVAHAVEGDFKGPRVTAP